MIRSLRLTALVAVVVMAAGCSAEAREARVRGADIREQSVSYMGQARTQGTLPYYEEVEDFYIGSQTVRSAAERVLPEVFSTPVRLRREWPITLNDVAEFVFTTYEVPVSVAEDALVSAVSTVYDPVEAMQMRRNQLAMLAPVDPGAPAPAVGGLAPQGASGAGGAHAQDGAFLMDYTGDLKGLLDRVAAHTNNAWRYENGRVLVFHADTRIFRLDIMPGNTDIQASISNDSTGGGAGGGGAGGGGGGSSASATISGGTSTSMSSSVNQFDGAVQAITGMLSPTGSISPAPGLGHVSVTDVPAVLERIEAYVGKLNSMATRQVVLDVRVLAIEHSGNDNYGISWDAVWGSLGSNVVANILSAGTSTPDDASLGVTLVDPTSRFDGTSLLVRALSTQGNLQQVTSASLATLSGQAVPVQVADETAYQSSVQTTLVPDAGAQTTRQLGMVTTGFSMVLLPIITEGDEMLLQMQINLSSLREIRQIGSEEDGSLVEAPQVASRQILQRVKLHSGQTLVLSGFEQETMRDDARGVGWANFPLLGGGRQSDRRKTTLVVLLTPRVVG